MYTLKNNSVVVLQSNNAITYDFKLGHWTDGETFYHDVEKTSILLLSAELLRAQRDALLSACDWTLMNDSTLSSDKKTEWQTYRTALRNIPQQSGFPDTVNWPSKPN